MKRFTVSLDARDYEQLRDLAERHRPPLSLQYVVGYAVRLFLDRAADEPTLGQRLGDPLSDVADDH